jgi:hypothetical protein
VSKKQRSVTALSPRAEISAQVIVRPAGGRPPPGRLPTAEIVAEFLPSPEAVRAAQEAFARAGFRPSHFLGNSFAITASVSAFERFFGCRLRVNAAGGIECAREKGAGSYELPLERMPAPITKVVDAVTFTPPPAFGPTDYSRP